MKKYNEILESAPLQKHAHAVRRIPGQQDHRAHSMRAPQPR